MDANFLEMLWNRISAVSPSEWLVTTIVFAVALFVADVFALIIRRLLYVPKFQTVSLKVREGEEPGVVRLVTSTRRGMKLNLGCKIRIWSVTSEAASRPMRIARVDGTLWGRNDGSERLAADEIEIPKEMLQQLFPRGVEADVAQSFEISEIVLEGFWLYWFHPDPSSRFQNRFAVYLSTMLTMVSVVIGFAPMLMMSR
jgi:hypothetical protein